MIIALDTIPNVHHGHIDRYGMWLIHEKNIYLLSRKGKTFVAVVIKGRYIELEELNPLREAVLTTIFREEVLRFYIKTGYTFGQSLKPK